MNIIVSVVSADSEHEHTVYSVQCCSTYGEKHTKSIKYHAWNKNISYQHGGNHLKANNKS